jgi:hypothetical protein
LVPGCKTFRTWLNRFGGHISSPGPSLDKKNRRWARYKKHQITRALRDGIPAASVEVLLDNIRYSGRPWATELDWMGLVTISHCGMGRTGTPGSKEGFDHT